MSSDHFPKCILVLFIEYQPRKPKPDVKSIRSCEKCLAQPQANVCLRNHKTVISTKVGPIVRLLSEITAFEQIFTQ